MRQSYNIAKRGSLENLINDGIGRSIQKVACEAQEGQGSVPCQLQPLFQLHYDLYIMRAALYIIYDL